MNAAQWTPIPGTSGLYEINTTGEIRRSLNAPNRPNTYQGRPMRFRLDRKGYLQVRLFVDGKRKRIPVHRLMARTYVPGWTEERNCVNHKDGKKTNNSPDNLEWVTSQENIKHANLTGLRDCVRGSGSGRAKITEAQASEIRQLIATGRSHRSLAREFGVSRTAVFSIQHRITWRHCP